MTVRFAPVGRPTLREWARIVWDYVVVWADPR